MEKTSSINSRIKELVDYFSDGNNSGFAALVGSSEANIRNYINGTQPKFDFISSVAQNIEINYEWLLTGSGKMLDTKKKIDPSAVVQSGDGINANYQGTFNEPINTVVGSHNEYGKKGRDGRMAQKSTTIKEENGLERAFYESEKKLIKAVQEVEILKQINKNLKEQLKQAVEEKDRAIADKDRAMIMLEKALSK